ncbi:MAG: hypothetical protein PWQ57_3447 [Desulfovibrionales bacterium]|nr:hypothetical protein [Desulfovibrionales bacterium]
MAASVEIAYRKVDSEPGLEALIHSKADKLNRLCRQLTGVRVAIEQEQRQQQPNNPYKIRLTFNIPPGNEIVVKRETTGTHDQKELWGAVRESFEAARTKLVKLNEQLQGKVKSHPEQQVNAIVEQIFPGEDYGFLRNLLGREVYFHKNSLSEGDFEKLTPGVGVSYTETMGEKGPQASTVRIVDRSKRNQETPHS